MVSIPATQSSAIALLRVSSGTGDDRDPLSFLTSGAFRASSSAVHDAITETFAGKADIRAYYAAAYARGLERRESTPGVWGHGGGAHAGGVIESRNVAHNALFETIMANRASFPPDGFSIHTDLGGGASITTELPPASALPAGTTGERTPAPAVSAPGTDADWRAARALASAAALDHAGAAVAILDTVLERNQTARERAEAHYRTA